MTRGVLEPTRAPGKAPAGRAASPWALTLALAAALLALGLADCAWAKKGLLPEGVITEVKIEGNVSITSDDIRHKILSRPGQELDQQRIDTDVTSLENTHWFSPHSVTAYTKEDPARKGYILIFTVKEMPLLTHVEFRGRKKNALGMYKIGQKELEESTGLKVGNRADATHTLMAVGQIQRLYAEKGYDMCEVRLVEGGRRGDTRVIIEIFEGEKRTIGHIGFEGNTFVSAERLRTHITSRTPIAGLIGGVYHADQIEEDARKLREFYQSQGFYEVRVDPVTRPGNRLGDMNVTFVVSEGTRYRLRKIVFEGNKRLTDAKLSEGMLMRQGQPVLETLKQSDSQRLMSKYYELGCLQTRLNGSIRHTDEPGMVDLVYQIEESAPFVMGELVIKGNDRTQDRIIRREANMAGLVPGELLDMNRLEIFKKRVASTGYFMTGQGPGQQNKQIEVKLFNFRDSPYGNDIGTTSILESTRMQSPGVESPPSTDRGVDSFGYARAKPSPLPVQETPAATGSPARGTRVAGGPPPKPVAQATSPMRGEVDRRKVSNGRVEMDRKRIAGPGVSGGFPDGGKNPVTVKLGKPKAARYGDLPMSPVAAPVRMQDPGVESTLPPVTVTVPPLPPPPPGVGDAPAGAPAPNAGAGAGAVMPFGGGMFNPPADTMPPTTVPPAGPVVIPPAGGAPPGPDGMPRTAPIGADVPNGMMPNVPGTNATDVGPDRGDAFLNRQYADVLTAIEENTTGKVMLGVGASGAQGLFGNASIIENNFNIWNFPRSFADITNGQAFRGGGQQFQVSAMVGTLINRFTVSLVDKMLFDLPIAGGGTGYIFNRYYPDWSEARGGGRFWIGRQFAQVFYADVAFRAEEVDFYGYRTPAPADYLAANGNTSLFSLRPSIRYDTRNAPFMPNKGQYIEASFEQGWGTFTFPKAEVEGRTYFTLGQRPDGSGVRTLEVRGHFGITGPNTPVYERFFAGYFGSLRGFAYRGVGPHILGSNIGGVMEALGSVEYMFPLTASDKVRQVIFCDFGTVTPNYQWDSFRASVGTGLRLTIPAMGPLPLAFDLAFPVVKAPGDHVQYFNFTMGANY